MDNKLLDTEYFLNHSMNDCMAQEWKQEGGKRKKDETLIPFRVIYIYIYILSVKSIWPPSKIFISYPKGVIFYETN